MINNKKNLELKEAITEVLVFFDIFSYPLNLLEIHSYLKISSSVDDLRESISSIEDIEQKNGFYFLKGRAKTLDSRAENYKHSHRKFKRAIWVTKIFSFVPWIKMIAIGNIIGANNLKDSSDIDFFIVTKKRRVWISRFICTSITKLLMIRPKVNDQRDKICLSFYLSEEAMNLEDLRIDKEDLYFVYWLANLIPVYHEKGFFEKFLNKNSWLNYYLPNWQAPQVVDSRQVKYRKMFSYREIMDLFFGGLESLCKKIQIRILPVDIKELQNKDTRVVLNEKVLKFHVNDRRREYLNIYKQKIKKIHG